MLVILCVFPKDEVGSFSGSFITFKINFKIFSNYNFSYLFCFIALVLFQNFLLYIYWISLPIFSSYHFLSNLFLFLTFLSFAFSILHYVLIFYFFIIFIYSCVLVQFHFWSDFFFFAFYFCCFLNAVISLASYCCPSVLGYPTCYYVDSKTTVSLPPYSQNTQVMTFF